MSTVNENDLKIYEEDNNFIKYENVKARFNTKISSYMKYNGQIVDVLGFLKGRDVFNDRYIVKFKDGLIDDNIFTFEIELNYIKDKVDKEADKRIMEEEKKFEFYSEKEIIDILKSKERLVIVDDGIDDAVIKYEDLPDFIVDVNIKTGYTTSLKVYDYHNVSMKPILTTIGQFLDKCEPLVRQDIIDRLVKLQTNEEEIKDYKLIDTYMLENAEEKLEKQSKNKKDKER